MSAEFERLVAEFEKFRSKIKHIDEDQPGAEQLRSEIGAIEARATSADRSVTVIAGPSGGVTDIQLTEDALKQRPQALAATLMSTLREAVADAARQQANVLDHHLSELDDTPRSPDDPYAPAPGDSQADRFLKKLFDDEQNKP